MKKLLSLTAIALAMFCVKAEATTSAARGPKESKTIGYSTAITTITVTNFNNNTSTSTVPGAVYGVYLGSGTAQDFCIMYDTNVITNVGNAQSIGTVMSNPTNQLGPRLMFGSTTQTTSIPFDPPLIFYSGLYVTCTGTTDGGAVVFETGRGLSGQ